MKNTLKIIAGLLIGILGGLIIAGILKAVFTDASWSDVFFDLWSMKIVETISVALVGMVAFLGSMMILVLAHEAGHLVCGLLSGYKFVSFRLFNLTFINVDGKLRVKKYSIAGTAGQCLLSPPDLPYEKIPTRLYFAGGILANLFLLLIALPFFFLKLGPFAVEVLVIFCLTDLFILIINGVPLKVNGIVNDGYDLFYLSRKPVIKRAVITQLRSNAMIQNGVRPKDMPDEWFEWKTDIEYKNPLEVVLPFMHASRLIDKMEWEDAYRELEELYSHKSEIMQLYVNELACELIFIALVTGRKERAREILDDNIRKYIEAYRTIMSSKQRVLCAIELYLYNDWEKAFKIYETLKTSKDRYLLQGEVESDLYIMRSILEK